MFRPSLLYLLVTILTVLRFGRTEECNDLSIGKTLQDPEDCHGYFLCHSGQKLQQYCAPGMKYDLKLGTCITGKCPPCNCDTPLETTSTVEPTSTEIETTESLEPTSTEPPTESSTSMTESTTSNTTESSPSTNSTSTETSSDSTALETSTTPNSTESSSIPTSTETSSELPITTSSSSSSSTSTTSRPKVSCNNTPNGQFLADPIHCRDYWVCRNGEPVLLHCQRGLWFDDINFVCNFPALVNCPAAID